MYLFRSFVLYVCISLFSYLVLPQFLYLCMFELSSLFSSFVIYFFMYIFMYCVMYVLLLFSVFICFVIYLCSGVCRSFFLSCFLLLVIS